MRPRLAKFPSGARHHNWLVRKPKSESRARDLVNPLACIWGNGDSRARAGRLMVTRKNRYMSHRASVAGILNAGCDGTVKSLINHCPPGTHAVERQSMTRFRRAPSKQSRKKFVTTKSNPAAGGLQSGSDACNHSTCGMMDGWTCSNRLRATSSITPLSSR